MTPMTRARAAAGSAVFFVLAPGAAAGLAPWWLTGWAVQEPTAWWGPQRVLGAILLAAGAAVLVHAFTRFAAEGIGTPAPVAPPTQLVVGGLYRYVRNPMYLGVVPGAGRDHALRARIAGLQREHRVEGAAWLERSRDLEAFGLAAQVGVQVGREQRRAADVGRDAGVGVGDRGGVLLDERVGPGDGDGHASSIGWAGGAGQRPIRVSQGWVLRTSVTGPSFSRLTAIRAPKLPVRVGTPSASSRAARRR